MFRETAIDRKPSGLPAQRFADSHSLDLRRGEVRRLQLRLQLRGLGPRLRGGRLCHVHPRRLRHRGSARSQLHDRRSEWRMHSGHLRRGPVLLHDDVGSELRRQGQARALRLHAPHLPLIDGIHITAQPQTVRVHNAD